MIFLLDYSVTALLIYHETVVYFDIFKCWRKKNGRRLCWKWSASRIIINFLNTTGDKKKKIELRTTPIKLNKSVFQK